MRTLKVEINVLEEASAVVLPVLLENSAFFVFVPEFVGDTNIVVGLPFNVDLEGEVPAIEVILLVSTIILMRRRIAGRHALTHSTAASSVASLSGPSRDGSRQ